MAMPPRSAAAPCSASASFASSPAYRGKTASALDMVDNRAQRRAFRPTEIRRDLDRHGAVSTTRSMPEKGPDGSATSVRSAPIRVGARAPIVHRQAERLLFQPCAGVYERSGTPDGKSRQRRQTMEGTRHARVRTMAMLPSDNSRPLVPCSTHPRILTRSRCSLNRPPAQHANEDRGVSAQVAPVGTRVSVLNTAMLGCSTVGASVPS